MSGNAQPYRKVSNIPIINYKDFLKVFISLSPKDQGVEGTPDIRFKSVHSRHQMKSPSCAPRSRGQSFNKDGSNSATEVPGSLGPVVSRWGRRGYGFLGMGIQHLIYFMGSSMANDLLIRTGVD